jgi:ubiquinone/menaquinone biosynthesis C-methylase UbiE
MDIFRKLSIISRRRKIAFFYENFQPDENTKILDVGAEINPNGDRGLQLIDQYPWKKNISALNISSNHISSVRKTYPEIEAVIGDACELPWPDNHFDIVYSNAVIEHLGSFERQKRMAAEIMRVGKRWFVCTPNRWYPFEFHLRLPLVTWLPGSSYLRIGRLLAYNHVSKRYVSGIKRDDLRLMTSRELALCFPCTAIVKQRVTFMAETLIAIGGKENDSKNE